MKPTDLTCTRIEEEDLDARYLAGTLSEEEAEAFEEHYFGCDRCWAAVQLGLDVRAANAAGSESRGGPTALTIDRGRPARPQAAARARRRWWPIAVAASVAVLAVAVWKWDAPSRIVPADDAVRGPGDSIRVVASTRGRMMVVSWPPKASADRYGVRLQKSDATVIIERIISDTSLAVPRDSLVGVTAGERVYWEVRALDALRRTIARSRLVPTQVPQGGR